MATFQDRKRNLKLAVSGAALDMPIKDLGRQFKSSLYDKVYYQKHKKKLNAYGKKWYWANRDKILKKQRARRRAARKAKDGF
jgi:hypothetical protein